MAAPGVEAIAETKNLTKDAQISTPLVQPQHDESNSIEKNVNKPLTTYTREQLLELSKSPLVQPPPGMPELKDWFGDSEHAYQKHTEPPTPNSARERRFRRDQEDGDTHSRNNFRPTASQPSQMGNFKHHSLRPNDRDRDRDRDNERDRDRDARDKDGLRHLSDKYDRDRLSSHPSGLRGKDRDGASHLSNNGATRSGAQSMASGTNRRSENREPHRKKGGDDDWRRDTRSGRDDRSEGGRRERDERERPRSRVRDSSRSRRDPSSSRRDRDRDDYKRDRDIDRENDEDSRHWRDDGRRDERMAARRAERQAERDRERERDRHRENAWENGDRRWASGDDRSKKGGGRDKRVEEGRDRDGRGEKEKEPAWMETYVPTPGSGNGILGGKTDGELDGIQAWKKELKEKEQREQEASLGLQPKTEEPAPPPSVAKPAEAEKPLDEIQLFKMLMRKEEDKKRSESPKPGAPNSDSAILTTSASSQSDNAGKQPLLSLLNSKDAKPATTSDNMISDLQGPLTAKHQDPAIQQAVLPASLERAGAEVPGSQFNPPAGSRLLALARASQAPKAPSTNEHTPPQTGGRSPPPKSSPDPTQQLTQKLNNLQPFSGYSPYEEQQRLAFPPGIDIQRDHLPESHRPTDHATYTPHIEQAMAQDALDNGFPANKGSRFAKFFDGNKQKEPGPLMHQPPGHIPQSSSPGPGNQRQNHGFNNNLHSGPPDTRTMDDIYAMLSNSGRGAPQASPLTTHTPFNRQPQQHNLHLLQQQLQQQQQQQQLNSRPEPLYDSRLDDRSFVPDGMVPGLRTTLPRSRDPINVYNDGLDEGLHYSNQRIPIQRAPDAHFSGIPPNLYHQGIRNGNLPIQQPHYRGGPSPISNQHGMHPGNQQQRLPPGLANLGGRPPHEPAQLLGMQALHGGLPLNGSNGQQPFNGNFPPNGNFAGPQIRGPLHLPNSGQHQQVGSHLNMEMRGNGQNQQFGGLAGLGGGRFPGQPGSGQLVGSLPQIRQQQQVPPGMMPHLLPQMHQQGVPSQSNQQSHDLMALLMGGSHRE